MADLDPKADQTPQQEPRRETPKPIYFRLKTLVSKMHRTAGDEYPARVGLKASEVWVLNVIGHQAPISAREIACDLLFDEGYVSRAISTLISRGLVVRVGDPSDGRRMLLNLSPKGKALFEKALEVIMERHERALAGVSPQDRERLLRILEAISDNTDRAAEMLRQTGGGKTPARSAADSRRDEGDTASAP